MFGNIYIENEIRGHQRTREILQQFKDATPIYCERYTEIFNRKSQNFRLQKKLPSLILARKYKNHVLPAPVNYGIGARYNYYFSHMLNCIYDCRYCFLQGMFRSAHYVLFVNFDEFADAISRIIRDKRNESLCFFSGYDCDSLAMEPVTRFTEYFLPVFEKFPNTVFELRTKSTQIRSLIERKPSRNCVIAYSFTPAEIASALEHKTPSIINRISAIAKLQAKGWQTGLRFDPLIYYENYKIGYERLFEQIFNHLDPAAVHSVSLGSFRLPRDYFRKIRRMYPEERLFASQLEDTKGQITYPDKIQKELYAFCTNTILKYIPEYKFFTCQ